jgi:hypothetical protein
MALSPWMNSHFASAPSDSALPASRRWAKMPTSMCQGRPTRSDARPAASVPEGESPPDASTQKSSFSLIWVPDPPNWISKRAGPRLSAAPNLEPNAETPSSRVRSSSSSRDGGRVNSMSSARVGGAASPAIASAPRETAASASARKRGRRVACTVIEIRRAGFVVSVRAFRIIA